MLAKVDIKVIGLVHVSSDINSPANTSAWTHNANPVHVRTVRAAAVITTAKRGFVQTLSYRLRTGFTDFIAVI